MSTSTKLVHIAPAPRARIGGTLALWCEERVGFLMSFVFLAVAISVSTFSFEARAADSAASFVETSVEKGNAILGDRLLDAGQRQDQFHGFLLSITDTKRTGLFTLGSYARGASEPDLAGFDTAFADFITATYQRGFDNYGGQTIRVTGAVERSADDTVVKADVIEPSGKSPPLKIAFRVRKSESGKYVLTDLQVEGVWLALIQLADFTAYLQQHRGEIPQLSKELDKRTLQLHARHPTAERQS
jgi:phospholipid transport system substrate-binding protein